ncbi:MAG: OmpA family protein [Candidatus Aminicenantes bacterium]|nr:MAG: OmpA family protein [Candidatus Aminicenantes bacterium]
MKKAILIPAFVLTFVIGVALSDLVLQGINGIFGKDIFLTPHQLKKKIEETQIKSKETEKKLADIKENYDDLTNEMTKKQANLNSFIKEIDTKIDPALINDILLKTPSSETGSQGRIFLDASGSEVLLEPTTTDDPTINRFKETFNKKAKDIIDAAKGILKNKVGEYNKELVRVNDELEERNVELIGKLKEVEKYKKEVDRVNEELKDRNTQLEAKLKEVEKYKKELEEQQKYINDLEGIKSNLEKTVGTLETKIEDGRLKVSFKGDILFESGRHQLRAEGKKLLDSVFSILNESTQQNDIFIAGHTDNVPIRADARDKYESNWTLSTYRAIEVVKYLTEKGIGPGSLTAAGYGEYKPIADNSTVEGKAKNRRVELFLIPKIIKRTSN